MLFSDKNATPLDSILYKRTLDVSPHRNPMSTPLSKALGLAIFSMVLSSASIRADDWKTTDGKVYQNVTVVKSEPDAVTILHHDGGARVPLANLSPDLQKKFNYDPVAAKAAVAARAQADAENAKALQAEMDLARDQKQAMLIATDPRVQNGTLAPVETPSTSTSSDPLAAPTDPTHHSMEQLVDLNKRLYDDHPDDTHHSIAFLKLIAHDLGPDLSDPTHHTIANFVAATRNLGPDLSDPTHHSMDQLFGTDPLARP
jgi:hypothetical protein